MHLERDVWERLWPRASIAQRSTRKVLFDYLIIFAAIYFICIYFCCCLYTFAECSAYRSFGEKIFGAIICGKMTTLDVDACTMCLFSNKNTSVKDI